jgi:hypothetical protein
VPVNKDIFIADTGIASRQGFTVGFCKLGEVPEWLMVPLSKNVKSTPAKLKAPGTNFQFMRKYPLCPIIFETI